jgi:hypothetical protein
MVTVPCECEANCLSIQKKIQENFVQEIHWKSIFVRLKCYNFIRFTKMMETRELQIVEKILSNF